MIHSVKQRRFLLRGYEYKMLEVSLQAMISAVAFVFFCSNLSQLGHLVTSDNKGVTTTAATTTKRKLDGVSCTQSMYMNVLERPNTFHQNQLSRTSKYFPPTPNSIKKIPINVIVQSQALIRYIFTKLHAPAVLMYGTLLYDIRHSANDTCLHINQMDKDIDIAVDPIHLQQIAAMKDQIYRNYRWEVVEQTDEMKQRGFLSLQKAGLPKGREFGIDFYAFQYNDTEKLIHFAWDGIKIERDAFLPLRKHKQMMSPLDGSRDHTSSASGANFYVPNNPDYLLCNIYGADYLIPKSGGPETQAKYGAEHGRPSFGNPECGFCC